jgi:hypothetical protein
MRSSGFAYGALAACAWAGGCGSLSAEPAQPAASPPAAVRGASAEKIAGLGASVGADVLAGMSGGADVSARISLDGTVGDNHADHVVTGSNAISSGSFQGAAGVPMVIQNTGNNVLIQNATIVNVQFRP